MANFLGLILKMNTQTHTYKHIHTNTYTQTHTHKHVHTNTYI